jgi:hypothetical protein
VVKIALTVTTILLFPLLAQAQTTFGPQQLLTSESDAPYLISAADLDGDGDLDVVSASDNNSKLSWFENTDGRGTFGFGQVISLEADDVTFITTADFDGDGDPDLLAALEPDGKIAWYENTDGRGIFGPQQVISAQANGAQSVFAADLDGDGDPDILSASADDDKIAWYENLTPLHTAAEPSPDLPAAFRLEPPVPNPFHAHTQLRFSVREAAPVDVVLYDALGRRVALLYRGVPQPGVMQTLSVERAGLPGGVYFLRLNGQDFSTTRALTLLK